ncbi:MAG: Tm-1-like ATP-binding domain-containing protein [Bacteroidetes bacterium]|nr:Tm-1-like ATP-binding domain-containing protein [Bacteroidota bacterium]
MVSKGKGLGRQKKTQVAITMLGNTTIAVMTAKNSLEAAGFEAAIFHSNGVGGPAMEERAKLDQFIGLIDYTTNEVYDPLVGGIHDGGPRFGWVIHHSTCTNQMRDEGLLRFVARRFRRSA